MSAVVLCVESPSFKALPTTSDLQKIGTKARFIRSLDSESIPSIESLADKFDVLIINHPNSSLMAWIKGKNAKAKIIMICELPMKDLTEHLDPEDWQNLDHIISDKGSAEWLTYQIDITLRKIFSSNSFGLNWYLKPSTSITAFPVSENNDREEILTQLNNFVDANSHGRALGRLAVGIAEELLMNILYDAPAAANVPRFEHISDFNSIKLGATEQGLFSYGFDGNVLALSASDPFGAFQKSTFFGYLGKVTKHYAKEDIVDDKKMGAGLGLFKILCSSHSLICNVSKGNRTEVIALISTKEPLNYIHNQNRSIHYF